MMEALLYQYLRLENYLRTGGPVMIPLAAVSLLMWLLIVERALFFKRLARGRMDARQAWEHVRDNRIPDPENLRDAASLLVAEFLASRSGNTELDRYILDETVLRLSRRLDDHLATIGMLAAVAPLLGLLGTVTGMITTFDVMAIFGTGNAKAMAGGISEALVTTQTGLLVAIPGLYMQGFLERRARNLKQRLSRLGFYLRRQLAC